MWYVCGICGVEFWVWDIGAEFRCQGLGVKSLVVRVWGLGVRIWGLGFGGQGLKVRICSWGLTDTVVEDADEIDPPRTRCHILHFRD